MVKIRLARGGVQKKPFYKIVACDAREKNKGKYLQLLGYWHPAKGVISIKKEDLGNWVKKGAKISPAVAKLLKEKE